MLAVLVRCGYENEKWPPRKITTVVNEVEEAIFGKHLPKHKIITTHHVSKLVHISERTITKQTKTNDIPFHTLPNSKHRRFNLKEICLWAELHQIPIDKEYLDKLIQGVA